jgi:Family of unknown function (DUF5996)
VASEQWPALPLGAWADTRDTLHGYVQIIGKIRLGLAPLEREWANVPFYLTARGMTTSAIPYGELALQINFDFTAHRLDMNLSNGERRSIELVPALSVAAFYERVMSALDSLGVRVHIWPMQVEVPNPIRLDTDESHASYDTEAVHRFWQVLTRVGGAFSEFRAPFRGRHTSVVFFWGTLDLAYARFSGRPAEPPPNSDVIYRGAMDAEQIEAGFWAGDARFAEPAFYCFGYPKPAGIETATIRPAQALWHSELGEFLLRYDDVRSAASPRAAILEFLESTYAACAGASNWDRAILDGTRL